MTPEQKRDIEFLSAPHLWPEFVCPVKRTVDGQMESAVVTRELRLIRINMFETDHEKWRQAAAISSRYDNAELLVAEGWRVD